MMLLSYPEFSSKFQVLANSKLSFCNPPSLKEFFWICGNHVSIYLDKQLYVSHVEVHDHSFIINY